jgi:hypothetical protein
MDKNVDVVHRAKTGVGEIARNQSCSLEDDERHTALVKCCKNPLGEFHSPQILDPEIASNSSKPVNQRIFYAKPSQILFQKRNKTLLSIRNLFEIELGSPRPVRSDGGVPIEKRSL